jgi:hypothetical protein
LLHSKFLVSFLSVRLCRQYFVVIRDLLRLDLLYQTVHATLYQTRAQICQSSLAFHLCAKTRSQKPLSFSVTAFIEIKMRPNTHECSQTVPIIVRVNFDASGLCRSSHVTNTGATGGGPIAYRHDVERNAWCKLAWHDE